MIDSVDRKLLTALQEDAHLTAMELSQKLNLSPSQIGRRKTRLEEKGFIEAYTARLNAEKIGLQIQAFIQVMFTHHDRENAASFSRFIENTEEITDAWTMTGDTDYLLRVYCQDLKALNELVQNQILHHPAVARVQSKIVMENLKEHGPLCAAP